MKSVRFSKVVEKSGKPEVYLLMSETDPEFRQALDAGKIMSLSGEGHGSGTEFGTVGYDKKRHGQLLLFPKSLKSFADARIIGVKYDLLAEDTGNEEKKPLAPRTTRTKESKKKPTKPPAQSKPAEEKRTTKKADSKPAANKLIPFRAKTEEQDDDLKAFVRQAMRALEKGNSVAAYNLLKKIIPEP